MKGKGATIEIKIYFTSSREMCKEVSMVEPCFPVHINPYRTTTPKSGVSNFGQAAEIR